MSKQVFTEESLETLISETKLYVNNVAADKQDKITGTAGQFVVIGSDGNVTTKTVYNFEEANF